MQQTADQSGSSSAALFPLWSLLARCLTMRMMMRMMMALLGRRLIWFWFFCSKQLKIHFHRFLIHPKHPTWSLIIVIFVVFVVTSLCREWDRASPRRPRSSDPSPGTQDCRSCTHRTWRLTIMSEISYFQYLFIFIFTHITGGRLRFLKTLLTHDWRANKGCHTLWMVRSMCKVVKITWIVILVCWWLLGW